MVKFISALACLAGATTAIAAPPAGTLVLNKDTFVFRGEVDGESVGKATQAILQNESDNMTIFFSSPGGSVIDGASLIQVMKASGKKFTCVSDFAASMAFVLNQACDDRVVMSNTVYMAHPMSYGVRGTSEYQVESFVGLIKSIGLDVDTMVAKRLKKSVAQMKAEARNDLWLYGKQAVDYGAADRLAAVTCDAATAKAIYSEEVRVFIFLVKVTWSACPLIASPLKVEMPGAVTKEAQEKFFKTFVNFRNPEGVIRN